MSNKTFYTHIEAFRGVAILLVVLYHLMPEFCSQGFYGVDAFLFISGYFLIGGFFKKNSQDFQLTDFIKRKIFRIIPPLSVMILVFLPIGFFFLPYPEMAKSAMTALTALFGYSNVYLDSNSQGYFSEGTTTNLFVHTWYSSVILQVYLIFGVVFWLLKKQTTRAKWCAVFCIGCISVACIAYQRLALYFPQLGEIGSVYYWTWARMVEVVLGASVILLPKSGNKLINNLVMLLALISIIFISFGDSSNHVIVWACCAALLWSSPQGACAYILDNSFFRFLGKHSFSIYLTHWPIIVCYNYVAYSKSLLWGALLLLLCLVVGIIAYHVVEKRRLKMAWTVGMWLVCLSVTYVSWKSNGLKNYLNADIAALSKDSYYGYVHEAHVEDYPGEVIDYWKDLNISNIIETESISKKRLLYRLGSGENEPSFVMMGDSHAKSFCVGMAEIANKLNKTGYYIPSYVTPFWDRMCVRERFCFSGEEAQVLLDWLKKHSEITHVVLVQRWSIRLRETINNDEMMPLNYEGCQREKENAFQNNMTALKAFCAKLKEINKKVIIMAEMPPIKVSPSSYLRRQLMNNQEINMSLLMCSQQEYRLHFDKYLQEFRFMELDSLCNVVYPHEYMFENGWFKAYDNNIIYMDDDDHISVEGALHFARKSMMSWRYAFGVAE